MTSSESTSILLLKTRSSPTDGYEDYFSSPTDAIRYCPTFIRVFEHQFVYEEIRWLRSAIEGGAFAGGGHEAEEQQFGGIIFTSQRAVNAFAVVISQIDEGRLQSLLPANATLFVVGPATAKAVRALGLVCPVEGEETGNGEALAQYILDDYQCKSCETERQPLLFLVGEQRRDIIPRMLQSDTLEKRQRIRVVERIIYETAARSAFEKEFAASLKSHTSARDMWVVVFSPTGCEGMLRMLGWLNQDGEYSADLAQQHHSFVRIATIGPTTREHLIKTFGFEPDVCARRPSPEGIGDGLSEFYERSRTHQNVDRS